MQLTAGFGRTDITPEIGTLLMGYPSPGRTTEGIRDSLQANALALRQGDEAAIVVSLTVCIVDDAEVEAIRRGVADRTGIPPGHITICSTQTHSAPCTQSVWGWCDKDTDYIEQMMMGAIDAATDAAGQLQPVRVGIATTSSDVGVNRRAIAEDHSVSLGINPWGVYDPEMTVLRFEGESGPLATMIHYGAHPTVLGSESRLVSRDWPGVMVDRVEALTGEHTLARYDAWLRQRFTLEQYNEHTLRRHASWDDVVVPRSPGDVVEMRLLQEFHRDNLVSHLDWMVDETRGIDPRHEVRAHGAHRPRPWDEVCAARVDSWGMSMPSNKLLTSNDPYILAERAFIFDLCRSIGVDGRWWNEEIYSGMSPAGTTWKKQSDPRELTMLMWMSLAHGAAGVMFWQYRPEYLSFESPGYSLSALDGEPTPRFAAVVEAVGQLEGLRDHLPIACPQAQVGIVYHPESQELFGFNDDPDRFNADLRGVYRTLWTEGIPVDVLTPSQDWSAYRLVFLPNAALMTDALRSRIERTLDDSPDTRLVAEGSFGLYSADGQSSYAPPEGFMDRLGMRVADFSMLDEFDIAAGRTVKTAFGASALRSPCGYAVLEAKGNTREIAHLGESCVGLQTADARFTWFGLTLSAGFGDVGDVDIVRGLTGEAGVQPPLSVAGDRVIPVVRHSRRDGRIIFLFNLEPQRARVDVTPTWTVAGATDLLTGSEIAVDGDGHMQISFDPWSAAVVHTSDT